LTILVTGSAGFIGFHLTKRLLESGQKVVGVDSLNDYYDVSLKKDRLIELTKCSEQAVNADFQQYNMDLVELDRLGQIFRDHSVDLVVHLAAQAGVRYSLRDPHAYVKSNIVAFTNILECCRHQKVAHLVYASTSSVYGAKTSMPFSENDSTDHPLQFYAATKKANEVMAHSYSNLFSLPTTGLRFFTVYGPWGRPDMALFKFTKNILNDEPIELFNNGNHTRDFTYVDDIVDGIVRVMSVAPSADRAWKSDRPVSSSSNCPFRILNIGNNSPVTLLEYVNEIERVLGKKALKTYLPLQPGDVPDTFSDTSALENVVGYKPSTPISVGVRNFVKWYQSYYQL
jgi:UDP-glucuronate 4-epimerase